MPDITSYKLISTNSLMSNITRYKNNPSQIQRIILDHLAAVTDGQVDIVDPTNPFVFLLEASAVNTAVAITEAMTYLRNQYPILAQTEEELYRHMSDVDYLNRFATPANAIFTFMIQYENLLNKMQPSAAENCIKVTIPRNTVISANSLNFSLQYPVDIKRYPSGTIQVEYDGALITPLQALKSNIVDYEIRTDSDGVKWLFFNIEFYQFNISTVYYPVVTSSAFNYKILFTDQFYYCRVFYQPVSAPTTWADMKTTHTDQVYDPFTPTAIIKVIDNAVQIYIPPVYIANGLIDGSVRIDVYTTKGEVYANMSNYLLTAFSVELKAIDEVNDYNVFTNGMSNTNMLAFTSAIVSGGSNGISFSDLRNRVINNSIGKWQIPITTNQFVTQSQVLGFDIIKHVDLITNRIFIATRNLPQPSNSIINSPAGLTIGSIGISLENLRLQDVARSNGNRVTLLSNCLFEWINGQFRLYTEADIEIIRQRSPYDLAEFVNSKTFFYCPFHYVFDNSSSEFRLRAYHLDNPIATNFNFLASNASIQLSVNTSSYTLEKINTGFRLRILTKSDELFKAMSDEFLNVQLAYIPIGETARAYVNGSLYGKTDGERIYEFLFDTNYDIDENHGLSLTNFKMYTDNFLITKTTLSQQFELFYITHSIPENFAPIPETLLLGKFLLPDNSEVITHEKILLQFGNSLEQLWTQSRSIFSGTGYDVYTEDMPLRYANEVYERDPVTGTAFRVVDNQLVYTTLHLEGEVVRDANGNPIIEHHIGDVIYDVDGNPVGPHPEGILRYVDLLFIEGPYYFVTDTRYKDYSKEVVSTLVSWITEKLSDIKLDLLEQTSIYFHPKKSHGLITVAVGDGNEMLINAAQAFVITLYIPDSLYRDSKARALLESTAQSKIQDFILKSTLSISELISTLREAYSTSVVSIRVEGLGGSSNLETLSTVEPSDRLTLKKKLLAQEDGTLIALEDIVVKFVSYT
jgi:hypothetical protein